MIVSAAIATALIYIVRDKIVNHHEYSAGVDY